MPILEQKITWDSANAFNKTLLPPFSWHRPTPNTDWIGEVADTGIVIDTWEEVVRYELSLEWLRIPASAWHGATGWSAFILYAKRGGLFRLYLDRTGETYHLCQAVEIRHEREPQKGQLYKLILRARDMDGVEFEV